MGVGVSLLGWLAKLKVPNVNFLPVCRPYIQLDFIDLPFQSEDAEFWLTL